MGRIKLRVASNALLALAAGAVLIVAGWSISKGLSLQNGYQVEADKASNQAASRGRVEMKNQCGPLTTPAKEKCKSEIGDTYRSYRHETRDLAAQRTSAIWMMFAGIAALIGMPVGIIGAWALIWTFFEQRRTSRAELRAYLAVEIKDFFPNLDTGAVLADIRVVNTGQTPAFGTRWAGNIALSNDELLERELLDEPELMTEPKEGRPNPETIHARRDIVGSVEPPGKLPPGELTDAVLGKKSGLYVFGTVWYKDAFETERFTNFCFKFVNDTGRNKRPPEQSLGWISTPFHNDSN
jgi:hypothetical protein